MYDKAGIVLRIETTVNDVSFFRHYRRVEHRDGSSELKVASMTKSIYSLGALGECLGLANMGYLAFVSELSDPSAGVADVLKLSLPVKNKGRSVRGVNLFFKSDLEAVLALAGVRGLFVG